MARAGLEAAEQLNVTVRYCSRIVAKCAETEGMLIILLQAMFRPSRYADYPVALTQQSALRFPFHMAQGAPSSVLAPQSLAFVMPGNDLEGDTRIVLKLRMARPFPLLGLPRQASVRSA